MVALAHVAGADLDDPVRQAERLDRALGAGHHVVEQRRCLFRCREGEDLDLVELVGPQHPACVAPGAAGLATVRRAVRHEPLRQLGGVEDLAGVDRRQRHLRGRDAPQVVALDRERVVGELRQLAGGRQGRRRHQRRRADLLVGIGVAIEAELAQRPRQRGTGAALHREHRLSDLGGPLVVEDAELGCRLPMWDSLMIGNESGRNGP